MHPIVPVAAEAALPVTLVCVSTQIIQAFVDKEERRILVVRRVLIMVLLHQVL